MGGGPSADERRITQQAEENARRQRELYERELEQRNQIINIAQQEDPLETRLRARDMAFMDWENQTNGPLDVRRAPGLGPALGLYESAARGQQDERMATGAVQMGLHGSDPNLALKLAEQAKARREQAAAGGLEQAVALKSAEVNRSALPLAAFAQDRRMGIASLASGNANAAGGMAGNAQGQYIGSVLNRQERPSFWRTLTQSGARTFGGGIGSWLSGGN